MTTIKISTKGLYRYNQKDYKQINNELIEKINKIVGIIRPIKLQILEPKSPQKRGKIRKIAYYKRDNIENKYLETLDTFTFKDEEELRVYLNGLKDSLDRFHYGEENFINKHIKKGLNE